MTMEPSPISDRKDAEAGSDKGSLWGIVYAPSIWALHFLVVYGSAAVICAKAPGRLGIIDTVVGAATLIACLGIVMVSLPAFQEFQHERSMRTDPDTAEGRSHFLAHACLLLAGLSLVGTLMQAMPAWLSASCR
jgi:hypothetical protein